MSTSKSSRIAIPSILAAFLLWAGEAGAQGAAAPDYVPGVDAHGRAVPSADYVGEDGSTTSANSTGTLKIVVPLDLPSQPDNLNAAAGLEVELPVTSQPPAP